MNRPLTSRGLGHLRSVTPSVLGSRLPPRVSRSLATAVDPVQKVNVFGLLYIPNAER